MKTLSDPIPSISELRAEYLRSFNQQFESNEELLEDALECGPFHEFSLEPAEIASKLPRGVLLGLYIPVARALTVGQLAPQAPDSVPALLKAYEQLYLWQRGLLIKPEDLLGALAEVRKLVALGYKHCAPQGRVWWIETVAYFKLLESGVYQSMGVDAHPLDSAYSDLLG